MPVSDQESELLMRRIEVIAANASLPAAYVPCVRFMLDALPLVAARLPPIARDAATRAVDYWNGFSDVASLTSLRVAVWRELDELSNAGALDSATDGAIRAVLCVLYDLPGNDDVVELLGQCVEFLTWAGVSEGEIVAMLDSRFPHG